MKRRILWADDEIDLLKSHIIFLEKKGYELTAVSNGSDAVELAKREHFDAVLLDEMMPGMDGLMVLSEIKTFDPDIPIVMITKSEEESIMDDALGSRISDYLIKPVNPNQIYTTLKRLLDSRELRSERISREYTKHVSQNRMNLSMGLDVDGWIQAHVMNSKWDIELQGYNDKGLMQIQADQKKEFRREFTKFVEREYPSWIESGGPVMSHHVLDKHVKPLIEEGGRVVFIIIDCFRLDHFLAIEPELDRFFTIDRDYYYSILPTATPFSRNALFAGLLPNDIKRNYPEFWQDNRDVETGLNKYESELMRLYFERNGIHLETKPHYEKVLTSDYARSLLKKKNFLKKNRMTGLVYNFVDVLSHQLSENELLQEIAPDEAAFRSLTRTWFSHSALLDIMKALSADDVTIVLTSDHGSITGERSSMVRGDRTTSTNVRYKYGKNLSCENSEVLRLENPESWGLPSSGLGTNFLFAKEDYYLIYKNNFRQYDRLYHNTLQHGGISMEEMILPVLKLKPR